MVSCGPNLILKGMAGQPNKRRQIFMSYTKRRIAMRNGKPAHEAFKGRVTLSAIAEHGCYQAAREALDRIEREIAA